MRWGVGKGRFRNLTALVLSAFLAMLFLVVWQFVRRIEPLAVDNTPKAATATVRDRLLRPEEDSLLRVTATNLRLFCSIADSVDMVYRQAFPVSVRRGAQWTGDSTLTLMKRTQMLCRRQGARALNVGYVPMATYEHCQAAVIRELGDDALRLQVVPMEIRRLEIADSAISLMRSPLVGVSESERVLIREVAYHLVPRLQPFLLGLAGDDVSYSSSSLRPKE
ncbi:MAG: hypothetical protein ACKOAG_08605 [Candidatus Kapaibacterium sp.]